MGPRPLPAGAEVRVALIDDDELDDKERAAFLAAGRSWTQAKP